MENGEKMYLYLFNRITDALVAVEKQNYGEAADILKTAQAKAEEMYIDAGDEE